VAHCGTAAAETDPVAGCAGSRIAGLAGILELAAVDILSDERPELLGFLGRSLVSDGSFRGVRWVGGRARPRLAALGNMRGRQ
jgi:hypothetical protein